MFTKKIKSLIAPIAILGAFTFLAMGSSSQDVHDFQDGYREGFDRTYKYLNSENTETDEFINNFQTNPNDSNSFAMSEVK